MAAASYGGRAMVWTLFGEPVVGMKASKKNLGSVAFSPDSNVLATSGLGADIELWSIPSGEHLSSLSGHEIAVWSLKFIMDGRYLVSLGYEQTIRLWDTKSWQEEHQIRPKSAGARGAAFSPEDKKMAVIAESTVEIWSTSTWQFEQAIPIGTPVVNSVSYSAGGKWLAVGAADRKIRLFPGD